MHVLVVALGASTRVPVLRCADELAQRADQEISVEIIDADDDSAVDKALERAVALDARLILAGSDSHFRAVLRRYVRRVLPAPSQRPAWLAEDRTIGDLPAVGLLPLDGDPALPSLAAVLGLPTAPETVAEIVLTDESRRLDLLRNDAGSITLHGAILGGAAASGQPLPWQARIDVDDVCLSSGDEPLLACAIANANGYRDVGGIPLVLNADPADGVIDVGVAIARGGEVEVRRARGRAVSVSVVNAVPFTDDGADGELRHKKTWWIEPAAWGVFTPR